MEMLRLLPILGMPRPFLMSYLILHSMFEHATLNCRFKFDPGPGAPFFIFGRGNGVRGRGKGGMGKESIQKGHWHLDITRTTHSR